MDKLDADKTQFEQCEAVASLKDVDANATKIGPDEFGFSPEYQKKIIRRIDYRLIITIGLMYCISLVDRDNMGSANLAGMGKELKLNGFRYVSSNHERFIAAPRPIKS